MAENHILLLPRIDYFKWVKAAQKFALHFETGITSDPKKAGTYKLVSVVVAANGYPNEGNIVQWLIQQFPDLNIDPIIAENQAKLSQILDQRIAKGLRYGKLFGRKIGGEVLPKYPSDRFYLFWPTDYPAVVQSFGAHPEIYSRYGLPGHEGIDLRAPHGSNVYACAAGQVYFIEEGESNHHYGTHIRIQHSQGYRTVYAHLGQVLVKVGDQVKARQLIGRADSTGNSVGQNLHLTLKKDQATAKGETDYPRDIIDPTPFLVYKHQEADVLEALGINNGHIPDRRYPWARSCLVGLASRMDGEMQEADYAVIDKARIEAVRINAKTSSHEITRLKKLVPDIFLLARLSFGKTSEPVSPKVWLEGMRLEIDRLYRHGVRLFEIQQAPNLQQNGWRTSWRSGEEFGDWWLSVAEKLWVEFSGVKLGFPGVSPGGQVSGQRMDANVFLDGADSAMIKADWLGVNCFWVNEVEMNKVEGGMYFKAIRERFPAKLIFITEFGNVNRQATPLVKGHEYVKYWRALREFPGIGAAFCQVVSAAHGYDGMVWRDEAGMLTEIVNKVREREF